MISPGPSFIFQASENKLRSECAELLKAATEKLSQQVRADVISAIPLEVEDLTDEQKFAIAVLSGVEWTVSDGKMVTRPCAIVKSDGKFHVYERARE